MATPNSRTIQAQDGNDYSQTTVLGRGVSESVETAPAVRKTTAARKRPDFTISFVLKPNEPPKGQTIA